MRDASTAALAGRDGSTLDARLEVVCDAGRLNARFVLGAAVVTASQPHERARAMGLAAEIHTILGRATRWGDVDQGSRELLRQRCEMLFDMVLPGTVKAALRAFVAATSTGAAGGRLTLALGAESAGLPWELMHTGQTFLGLGLALGRAVGTSFAGEGAAGRRSDRMLVVCDPRGDLVGSYYEGLTLRDELGRGRRAVDLRSTEVGVTDVRRLLREYDIVHFAGHAEPVEGGERGWWLRDGILGPSTISELAGGRRFPRLVFSNACRSASDGTPGGEAASGLAQAFLGAGVEHYVGTVHDVPDEPASLFALTFYATLVARPEAGIGEAVRAARVALAERYGPTSVYWAAWILYGAPEAAVFMDDVRASAAPSTSARAIAALGARVRGATAIADAPASASVAWWPMLRAAAMGAALVALVSGATWLTAGAASDDGVEWTGARGVARMSREGAQAPRLEDIAERALDERYGVRLSMPEAGYIALWHLSSDGRIERVDRDAGPLAEVEVGSRIAPSELVRWVAHAPGRGIDRFYLAWRQVPPSDPALFEAELRDEAHRLRTALQAGRADMVQVQTRFEEALDDHFENVTGLVVDHR